MSAVVGVGNAMASFVGAVDIKVGAHPTFRFVGLTFNTDDCVATLAASVIFLAIGFYARARATSGVPGKLQLTFETVVTAVERQIQTTMGDRGMFAAPLAVVLFFFILICNWFEIIPTQYPSHFEILPSPTGDINMPLALAVLVIVLVHVTWIRMHGLRGYLAHYTKPYAILTPINMIEELVKPVTLALRLFGNIFAGGILIELIAGFPAQWIIPLPVGQVVWKLFDAFFVSPVQAFIFALLTLIYLESAVTGGH